MTRFQDMAYGCAYAVLGDFHLAEDATQDAFLEVYGHLGSLSDPNAFPGWLRTIVLRRCNRMRRRKRLPTDGIDAAAGAASDSPGPDEAAEASEIKDQVLETVKGLPENERLATTLFYINGYSHQDIAEFLDLPLTTVNNRLHAARQRLKERMVKMLADTLQEHRPGPEFARQLFNGINLDKWWIDPDAGHYTVENGELLVENPQGDNAALHAEVGGMSWDDYRVGLDVLLERDSSPGKRFPFNVQLCPQGTCVFCQLFAGRVMIAYWDNQREPHFTHLASAAQEVPIGVWQRFEILVEKGGVAVSLNAKAVTHSQVPRGTRGMLGLIVNSNSDARVRLRNIQITFLRPIPQQLKELETDATTNWEDFRRREPETGTGQHPV